MHTRELRGKDEAVATAAQPEEDHGSKLQPCSRSLINITFSHLTNAD